MNDTQERLETRILTEWIIMRAGLERRSAGAQSFLFCSPHAVCIFVTRNPLSTCGIFESERRTAMKGKLNLLATILAVLVTGAAAQARVVPKDTTIKVRTDTAIPAKPADNAKYTASVSSDVTDSSGAVIIPRGSRATLVAVPNTDGKDTTLDLRSVVVNGQRYLLTTQTKSGSSAPGGLGANARTGKYVGGGAAVGAVLGAIFGGGKGAAIGALAGGAGGAGAQVYTGRKKEIPAETELSYKLAQDLQMRPMATRPSTANPK
jgi:hypothetical protein